MGCVLVRGVEKGRGGDRASEAVGTITLRTINSPMFGAHRQGPSVWSIGPFTGPSIGLSVHPLVYRSIHWSIRPFIGPFVH